MHTYCITLGYVLPFERQDTIYQGLWPNRYISDQL